MRNEIGADDFAEVVEIFLEEVEEEMTKLDGDPDRDTLGAVLHFLKGSALNLGFSQFSDQCQNGEGCVRSDLPVDIGGLKQCYVASKAEFLSALNALDAA